MKSCFELWALLHFQDQNAWVSRHDVQRLCRKHMPGYEKHLPCQKLLPLIAEAFSRADKLRKRHLRNGTELGNPLTGVDFLVRSITEKASG